VEILKRYEKWKDVVKISGPSGLRLIKGFHDEALKGKWRGHRSSRLGQQYRIIYKIEEREVFVLASLTVARIELRLCGAIGYIRF
jgi:addiction module RelE/StbE family toxin